MDNLPDRGTPETNRFDIKGEYDHDKDELAKDITALANANGGVLLYGTFENASAVARHKGLTKDEVKTLIRDVEHVVLYNIHPKVSVTTPQLVVDKERSCVAVTVEPSPGQAVGVRKDAGSNGPWDFPVRVGTQTDYFAPEQLVLLMDVPLRRKVQMLVMAQRCEDIAVHHTAVSGMGTRTRANLFTVAGWKFSIETIDAEGASVRLTAKSAMHAASCWVPMQTVHSVWRQGVGWHMRLDGELMFDAHPDVGGRLSYRLNPAVNL